LIALALLAVCACLAALLNERSPLRPPRDADSEVAWIPITGESIPTWRPVYRHSVVPGGTYSAPELEEAIRRDPVVAAHYANFRTGNARVVELSDDLAAHVSYRVGNKVFWTRNKLRLAKGERLLFDGRGLARTRCGNRVSLVEVDVTQDNEPPPGDFDTPIEGNGSEVTAQPEPPGDLLPFLSPKTGNSDFAFPAFDLPGYAFPVADLGGSELVAPAPPVAPGLGALPIVIGSIGADQGTPPGVLITTPATDTPPTDGMIGTTDSTIVVPIPGDVVPGSGQSFPPTYPPGVPPTPLNPPGAFVPPPVGGTLDPDKNVPPGSGSELIPLPDPLLPTINPLTEGPIPAGGAVVVPESGSLLLLATGLAGAALLEFGRRSSRYSRSRPRRRRR